jgi:hypothetical protein
MAIFPKILLFAPIALLFACSSSETAGGTTETENAIAMEGDGTVSIHVFAGKSEASRIAYRVLPSWFVPDTTGEIAEEDYTYRGTADSTGKIVIENHKQGSFTIQIGSKDSVIAYQYTLNNLSEKFDVKHASLTASGSVKGWISVPENAKHAWVHIPGTGKVQKTDSLGNFVINGVPSGDLVLRAWDTDTKECIAEAEISVPAKDTLELGHVEAPNEIVVKKTMRINPSKLISSWMQPLTAPFVLTLRLDSTNFNFSEALPDGSDIHLRHSDGTEIPMQIDLWDTSIQNAAINVLIQDLSDTAEIWTLEWGEIYEPAQEQVDVWKDIDDSLWYELNSVEIFNFDSVSAYNDLPSAVKKHSWYIQLHETDSVNTDSVTITTLNATDYLQKDTQGRGGYVVHLNYKEEYPNFAAIGTRLSYSTLNLSRMDSLIVWIRGDGEYEIILENFSFNNKNYKASYKAEAKSSWQRVVVRPEDFNTVHRDYHGWESTRDKITHFSVFVYNGSEIWLDNVRIYGINRDEFN